MEEEVEEEGFVAALLFFPGVGSPDLVILFLALGVEEAEGVCEGLGVCEGVEEWMISPGRGLRLGVREEEGRVGGAKVEKEEKEESNSAMFLFLLGVMEERERRGRAGEGFVAELRVDENDESRLLFFGVIEEEIFVGRRIPDGAGFAILLGPAAGTVFAVRWESTLGRGLLAGIWNEGSKSSADLCFDIVGIAFLGIPDTPLSAPAFFGSACLGISEVIRGGRIELSIAIDLFDSVVNWKPSRLISFLGSRGIWNNDSDDGNSFLCSGGKGGEGDEGREEVGVGKVEEEREDEEREEEGRMEEEEGGRGRLDSNGGGREKWGS